MVSHSSLDIYKYLHEERKSEIDELIKSIENKNAVALLRDIVFQLDNYHGQHIHTIKWDRGNFNTDLEDIEKLRNPNLTIKDLKDVNPEIYYRFIGDHLYCIMTDTKRGIDKFLKI